MVAKWLALDGAWIVSVRCACQTANSCWSSISTEDYLRDSDESCGRFGTSGKREVEESIVGEVNPTASLGSDLPAPPGYRRGRGRELLAVLAILSAVMCLFYYQVIFLGRTFLTLYSPAVMGLKGPFGFRPYGYTGPVRPDYFHIDGGASTWQFEPWARKVGHEYMAGRFPLWNEDQGFGAPLLGNGLSGGLDLLRLPLFVSSSALALDGYYLARVMFGAFTTYIFARLLGLAWSARLFLAIAYVFSGHFLIQANNSWIEAYFLLPVVLIGEEITIRGRARWGFVITAWAVALVILVGMPEVTLFVLLFGAGYGGYQLLRAHQAQVRRIWLVRSAVLVAAWLVGLALATPLLLPLFEYVGQASQIAAGRRLHGVSYERLGNFVSWFIPRLIGADTVHNPTTLVNNYVGTTVLVLAMYNLFPSQTRLYSRLAPITGLMVGLFLAKSFGVPGINALGRLPALDVTWIQEWSAPVSGFGLALLASVSVHRLSTERFDRKQTGLVLTVFGGLLFLGIALNWNAVRTMSAAHLWTTVGLAGACALGVSVVVHLRPRLSFFSPGLACCLFLILELFLYAYDGVYQSRYDRYSEPPFVRFLTSQNDKEPYRIFATDGILFPNTASAYGLRDIRALDALNIDRYLTYVQAFLAPNVFDRFVGTSYGSPEQPARLRNNPWFDLTGVRYVITATESDTAMSSTSPPNSINAILAANLDATQPRGASSQTWLIDGVRWPVLFEHPPARLRYPLRVTADRSMLRFSPTLDPAVWDATKGDGVMFKVSVEVPGREEVLYERVIDPKHDLSQRHWLSARVDLSRFIGQDVVLFFTTDPLGSADYDWAGWGDIRLTSATGEPNSQYLMVYNKEVRIFENQAASPRAFLVPAVTPIADADAALALMRRGAIDPLRHAVVEGNPPGPFSFPGSKGATATITAYNAQQVRIEVNAADPSFLVLTDAFYPGWNATVDGRPVPVYPTDLAFRGVAIPAGHHHVEIYYQPASFRYGLVFAGLAAILLVVVAIGMTPWQWRRDRRTTQRRKQ